MTQALWHRGAPSSISAWRNRSRAELIEIRCGKARLFGVLHDTARVNGVDSPPVVDVKGQWNLSRRRKRDVSFALPTASILEAVGIRIHSILNVVAEFIESQASTNEQPASPEAEGFLRVSRFVCDMRVRSRRDASRHAAFSWIQSNIDLVVVKVDAGEERRGDCTNLVYVRVLSIHALLKSGIVLLKCVTMYGVVKEVREIRVEIEQGATQEPIDFESVTVCRCMDGRSISTRWEDQSSHFLLR